MIGIYNQTLETLRVETGSVGQKDRLGRYSFEDAIFEKYYNVNHNSTELNIDYTNYNNFVFYSSARNRLAAFRQKLSNIERLQQELGTIFPLTSASYETYSSGSLIALGKIESSNTAVTVYDNDIAYPYTGSNNTAYWVQEKTKKISLEIEDIIRSFDPYEEFLFFDTSEVAYSASAAYTETGTEYNVPAHWPKNPAGQLYGPLTTTAQDWFISQSQIAERYDEQNKNNLLYTIPMYILEMEESSDFLTFITTVGHMFDNIKPYIDQYPLIYDRTPNPDEGLSKELLYEVAESQGVKLPNLLALRNLQEFIIGSSDGEAIKNATAEAWKRILHNLMYIFKTKGTKTAIQTLLQSLGFHTSAISIKESGVLTSSSLQLIDEFSTNLNYGGEQDKYIVLPMSSSLRDVETIQFRFNSTTTEPTESILTADTKWSIHLVQHPQVKKLYRLEVHSGSNFVPIISSSYDVMNDGDFYKVCLRRAGGKVQLHVFKNIGGKKLFSSTTTEAGSDLYDLWSITNDLYLGGSGSLVVNSFKGKVDEVRMWGEVLSDVALSASINDPGSIIGSSPSSSVQNLYVQLSFYKESDLSTGFIVNESPYFNKLGNQDPTDIVRTNISQLQAVGFETSSNYTRNERQVQQNLPTLGSSGTTTSKIQIKSIDTASMLDSQGVPVLSRTKSHIVRTELDANAIKETRTVSVTVSPVDYVNQQITRVFGTKNINDAVGKPEDQLLPEYTELRKLQDYYNQYFYAKVDANRLITIFESMISGMKEFIESLVPAHSTLLFGILIEPNILERKKINLSKRTLFDGTGARKTLKSISDESLDYRDTIYSLEKTIDVNQLVSSTGLYLTDLAVISENILPKFWKTPSNYSGSNQEYPVFDSTFTGNSYSIDTEFSDELIVSGGFISSEETGTINVDTSTTELFVTGALIQQPLSGITIDTNYGTFANPHFDLILTSSIDKDTKFVSTQFLNGFEEDIQYPVFTNDTYDWFVKDTVTEQYYSFKDAQMVFAYNEIGTPAPSSSVSTGSTVYEIVRDMIKNYGRGGLDIGFDNVFKSGSGDDDTPEGPTGFPFRLPTGIMPDVKYFYEISPITELNELGSSNYFYQSDGVYDVDSHTYVPVNSSSLNFLTGVSESWIRGGSYQPNDCVIQLNETGSLYDYLGNNTITTTTTIYVNGVAETVDITSPDVVVKLTAKQGNGFRYRFKGLPGRTTAIQSWLPPSLDAELWEPVLYDVIKSKTKKRVIFDYRGSDLTQMEYSRLNIVSLDKVVNSAERYIKEYSGISIPSSSYTEGTLQMEHTLAIYAYKSTVSGIRIRLYRSLASLRADESRPYTTDPTGSHGVIFDTIITTPDKLLAYPPAIGFNDDEPETSTIYYRIDDLSGQSQVATLTFNYFALEPQLTVPLGYLPRHYKYFRDNSIGTKRRNYLGCLQTQDTTTDGGLPVQITLSSGKDLVVSPTSQENDLSIGGGGTLNVT